jgi:hypothetical protein
MQLQTICLIKKQITNSKTNRMKVSEIEYTLCSLEKFSEIIK